MNCHRLLYALVILPIAYGQGTLADYRNAAEIRDKYPAAALHIPDAPHWIDGGRFWYRRTVEGGHDFVIVDAATGAKKPAFDHEKLAASLSKEIGKPYTGVKLPLGAPPPGAAGRGPVAPPISFVDGELAIEFTSVEFRWKCSLENYSCQKLGPAPPPSRERPAPEERPVVSPDNQWEALVRNHNVYVRPKGKDAGTMLSFDGAEDNAYTALAWSPDSRKLAAYRVRKGYRRQVHYVESSPLDQLQPKHSTIEYAKPGDVLDLQQPELFLIDSKKQIHISNGLFPNPYQLSRPVWRKDSSAFTFEYNQRGHQVYRVIEVDATNGNARTVIDEEARKFFCYSGKKFRQDVNDGREIVWMSERDGWNHLYLYDGATGKVKNQITRGNWPVRGVERVDDEKRQVWFRASGMTAGKDPYFVDYYRINFDGTGLTAITHGDGTHTVTFSPDHRFYVDTWSRVDAAPVSEIHRTGDLTRIAEVERGEIDGLAKLGRRPPEVFVAKGRDGKTDIWGNIYRPRNFDPARKYPVIENIYAGPQDSFVPKAFQALNDMEAIAELGFIVVQIDGMGTSNRSKAFHDVCWKNLADAGFPDRLLWHKAVAAKYPWYDISRVGIYGTSAGGQNAMGGLLFHPEFYRAGVASCGCHDNRMDKIWWNEQWMGWPLGPEYVACSNMENASKLQGKLMLFVGEMDTNVDPSSTMQVVNALIKAKKEFDLLVLPGMNHTNGGSYGDRKRYDFFVHHLLGVEPPDWNLTTTLAALLDTPRGHGERDVDEAASFFEEEPR